MFIRPYHPVVGDFQILNPLGQVVVTKTDLDGAKRLREGEQTVRMFTHQGWEEVISSHGFISEGTIRFGMQFARPWNVDRRTWIEASVKGPWAVENSLDSCWGVINTETGARKAIGQVHRPRSHSKVNYFDRAMEEAVRRNLLAGFTKGSKIRIERGTGDFVGVVDRVRTGLLSVLGADVGCGATKLERASIASPANLIKLTDEEFNGYAKGELALAALARPLGGEPGRKTSSTLSMG